MINTRNSLLLVCAVVTLGIFHSADNSALGQETRLLRFPDLQGDRVVFTYAGDLWTASDEGGKAERLTTHEGLELFGKFSPDGRHVAFTGQYEGAEQVYAVSSQGGEPKQLTYYPSRGPLPDRWGYDHQVQGWTPDGNGVVFRSMRGGWSLVDNRLFVAPLEGGLPTALPMPRAGSGDIGPDGKRVVYSPLFRDFRTWKRYQGGWAQDLYIFDPSGKHTQITDHPRTDRDAMWIGGEIYYASDRDGTLNLYAYDIKSKKTRQITNSKKFDVRWPSRSDDGRIIYELGGRLHIYDTKSEKTRQLKIWAPNDHVAARPKRISVANRISSYDLSPNSKRVLVSARGDIFTIPAENGVVRNLTKTSSAHEKSAAWSPDGSRIAYLSDASGEEELYVVDQLGAKPAQQLTNDGDQMRYSPTWSPDNRHIAFSDKSGRLFVLDADKGKKQLVAQDKSGQLRDYVWSPRGGFLAFTLSADNDNRSIHIWAAADGKVHRATSDDFNEFSPTWDPEGDYLYYLSDRQFAPQIGAWEWNFVGNRETGVYAMALRKDVAHPFPPSSDDEEPVAEKAAPKTPAEFAADTVPNLNDDGEDKPKKKKGKKKRRKKKDKDEPAKAKETAEEKPEPDDKDAPIKIDFDGLAGRVAKAPISDDNLGGLSAIKGKLIYVRTTPFFYGRSGGGPPEIHVFDMKSKKSTKLTSGGGYALTDKGKLLVRGGGGFAIYDVASGKASTPNVSTSGLMATVVPREEWRQIFGEVWRRFRDFFYVENMHGYDWVKLRKQYEPLLKDVGHRTDLNYVLGEMAAELNVGHAYIAGGDFAQPDRPAIALLGAQLKADEKSGRYRIADIFEGQNEETIYRSPLTEIGVDASEGDYLLAIDGEPVFTRHNPYAFLQHKAGQPVTLTLNNKPTDKGSRTITIRPIAGENDLNYLNWVLHNRRQVAKATQGKVGYLHLPNMGPEGIREFTKWFYSQTNKQGLIIDVRKNGGGNVSQMVINRLTRKLLATRSSRNNQRVGTYPETMFHGHLVCLLDENSASDGDIFPAMFREAGLGPLIGKRSWGGVIGITNRGTLIDGGSVNVPEYGFLSADGKWVIEGVGVAPDIEVDNDPHQVLKGRDQQLERGLKEILERIKKDPRRIPNRPKPPIRTK